MFKRSWVHFLAHRPNIVLELTFMGPCIIIIFEYRVRQKNLTVFKMKCAVSNVEDSNIIVYHHENIRYHEDSRLLGFYTGSCFGLLYPENEDPLIL
jgi:hypothetical protein